MTGEFELIRKLTQSWRQNGDIFIGPGDDASAIVIPKEDDTLFLQTIDLLIEDVHFQRGWGMPEQLGWKSLAVNLSDIAAMGGKPTHTHLSLAIPPSWSDEEILKFMSGYKSLADRYNVRLLGGDLSRSKSSLMIASTANGIVKKDRVITRGGAKIGDIIWISGNPGEAAGGLKLLQEKNNPYTNEKLMKRFLEPAPEVELGIFCAECGLVQAMIDVSDGLAGDLGHILKASNLGATLFQEDIPFSPGLSKATKENHWDALELALHGGEDYHLLGTTSEDNYQRFTTLLKEKLNRTIYKIGRIEPRTGLRLRLANGNCIEIPPTAYDHFS